MTRKATRYHLCEGSLILMMGRRQNGGGPGGVRKLDRILEVEYHPGPFETLLHVRRSHI